jgi:hypothetical protein
MGRPKSKGSAREQGRDGQSIIVATGHKVDIGAETTLAGRHGPIATEILTDRRIIVVQVAVSAGRGSRGILKGDCRSRVQGAG